MNMSVTPNYNYSPIDNDVISSPSKPESVIINTTSSHTTLPAVKLTKHNIDQHLKHF